MFNQRLCMPNFSCLSLPSSSRSSLRSKTLGLKRTHLGHKQQALRIAAAQSNLVLQSSKVTRALSTAGLTRQRAPPLCAWLASRSKPRVSPSVARPQAAQTGVPRKVVEVKVLARKDKTILRNHLLKTKPAAKYLSFIRIDMRNVRDATK